MASDISHNTRVATVPAAPEDNDGCDQQPPLASISIVGEAHLKTDVVQESGLVQHSELVQGSEPAQESEPVQESEPIQQTEPIHKSQPVQVSTPDTPPTYTIDLSLPPAERYVEVANDFKDTLVNLPGLVDDLFEAWDISVLHRPAKRLAKLFFRRVHSDEQTEELRGISQAVGVEMYLLVAFNTLIDMLIGCISGGMKASDGDKKNMFHFWTLDLDIDVLRKLVVQFDYVEKLHGKVVARSIGYVGFVGMLTGVRPGLSQHSSDQI